MAADVWSVGPVPSRSEKLVCIAGKRKIEKEKKKEKLKKNRRISDNSLVLL